MLGLWSGLSRASKRLIACGVALMLAGLAAVSLALWDTRATALEQAAGNANGLGIAIAEQTARSFQAVALVLQGTQNNILIAGIATPAAFKSALRTEAIHYSLLNQEKSLPQANAFTIIGADGQLINFSRRWPIPATDLSDRDYFKFKTPDPGTDFRHIFEGGPEVFWHFVCKNRMPIR